MPIHGDVCVYVLLPVYEAMSLREAAQQALEAMNKATGYMKDSDYVRLNQAIDTLRTALAEPEQEPVAVTPSSTRYTVEVEGRDRTYWDNIHDAITNAQRAVYATVDATTRAIDDLKAGRMAEWSYGFSAVRIYPPMRAAHGIKQEET